jgi:hypothetical protein
MSRDKETIRQAGDRIGALLERMLPAGLAEREEVLAFVREATIELESLDRKFGTTTVWARPFPELPTA